MSEGHYLRKIDEQMGQKEYEMYRAIPAEELGWENPAHHFSYEQWREFLYERIKKEFDKEDPCVTHIMYLGDYPIGIINLYLNSQSAIGKNERSGSNVSYIIRPICRGTGLGRTMLELAIDEARKLGIKKLTSAANRHNAASWKTMEDCGFTFIKELDYGSKYYELNLEETE